MSSQVSVKATSFADLAISTVIHEALGARGIVTPSPIQAEVVPLLLAGRDVIAQARTGSGKTLAFALPIIERLADAAAAAGSGSGSGASPAGIQALVLVPTRELAIQVGDVFGPLAALRRLRTTLLYGGRSLLPEARAVRSAQIVIGTPGRTLDHLRQGQLNLRGLRVLVLDEADEMLDRGFARDVERIIGFTPASRQSALFSATVPAWVAGAARTYLREPASVSVDAGQTSAPEIEQTIYTVPSTDKLPALMTLLDRRDDGPVIVFGRTKHGVKKLAQKLAGFGYPAAALQGNLSQNARERVMTDFRSGRMPILLATNVAARGLDVAEVDLVINYELPETAEWFTHRVGRTGRMGRRGQAVTFLTPEDGATWRQFERQLGRSFPRRAWGSEDDASPAPRAAATGTPRAAGATTATDASATGATAESEPHDDGFGPRRDGFGPRRDGFGARRDGFGARRDGFGARRDGSGPARTGRDGRRDGQELGRDARDGRRDGFRARRDASEGSGDGGVGRGEAVGARRDGADRREADVAARRGDADPRGSGRDSGDGRERSGRPAAAGDVRRDAPRDGLRDARRDAPRDVWGARRDGVAGDERRRDAVSSRDGRRDAGGARRDAVNSRDGRRDAGDGRRAALDARRDGSAGRGDGFDGPRDGAERRAGSGAGAGRRRSAASNVAMKVAGRRPSRRGRKPASPRGARSAAA